MIVGTRAFARDWTVARAIADDSIRRANQLSQTNENTGRPNDQTIDESTKCPYSHDTHATTSRQLACDQHDRTNELNNVSQQTSRSDTQNNRLRLLFLTNLVCATVTSTQFINLGRGCPVTVVILARLGTTQLWFQHSLKKGMNPGSPPTSDGRGPRSGRHGGRGTGRSGRGGRHPTASVTPRQRFDGATDELKGEIFDLVGSRSADLFIKTKKSIANYVGRTYQHSGDIR